MNEDFDRFFGEQDIFGILKRYQDMLDNNRSYFFDLYEFEEIIDYYLDNEDIAEAFNATITALNSYPFAPSLKLRYAKTLVEKGLSTQALKIVHEIETIEMYNYELHLIKGKVLCQIDNHGEALKEFDKAIRFSRENRDEVIYNIAQAFLSVGKESIAIKYLLLAHEVNEKNLLVLYDLASCFDQLEYFDKSIEYFLKFLDLDPFAENVWFNLGVSYARLERYVLALEALDFSIAINPGYISACLFKAELLSDLERYNESISIYNELLESDSNNIKAICYLGECYEKTGEISKALEYFRMAKKIDNTCPDPWFGMAILYKNRGKLNHSLKTIHKALKLEDNIAEYWFFLGELYSIMQQNENSMKAFARAIEIDPSYYEAWLAYAKLYYEDNKVNNAIEILNRAYQYNYDNSTLNYQLAAYHTTLHEYSVAVKYFEKGLALNFPEHEDYLCQIQDYFDTEMIQVILSKYQKYKFK